MMFVYTDDDECLDQSLCVDNATCSNTVGSYICMCDPGFTGDGNTNCSSKHILIMLTKD